jgi:methyltransferase
VIELGFGWPQALVTLVALQRLGELWLSRRNGRRLLAEGALELGARHYPLIVGLQVLWLVTLFLATPPEAPLHPFWLAAYLLLQVLRAWVIASLGRFWTTRVYHLQDVPLVRRGPYRWLRHPNYVVVAAETVVLPLVVGLWWASALFGALQMALLFWRVKVEDAALSTRR